MVFGLFVNPGAWLWEVCGSAVDWCFFMLGSLIADVFSWLWSLLPLEDLAGWWNGIVDDVDYWTTIGTLSAEVWAVLNWFLPCRQALALMSATAAVVGTIRFGRWVLSFNILGTGFGR